MFRVSDEEDVTINSGTSIKVCKKLINTREGLVHVYVSRGAWKFGFKCSFFYAKETYHSWKKEMKRSNILINFRRERISRDSAGTNESCGTK